MKRDDKQNGLIHNNFYARIVIKFQDDLHLPYYREEEINDFFSQNRIFPWRDLLRKFPSMRVNRLFKSLAPGKILELVENARKADPTYQPPNFLTYYVITCSDEINLETLAQMLHEQKKVELAYIEGGGSVPPPCVNASDNPLNIDQGYLNVAPEGINACYAWNFKGGDGTGRVNFIDIEQGWILNHEDVVVNTLPDTGINKYTFQDHGIAVLGIVMMQDNQIGGIGITPNVKGHVISQWRTDGLFNSADAIMTAINHLGFGDILLLESQVFDSPESYNFWPIEIQQATFEVIRLATASGIIVIEPAGNGNLNFRTGNDLDRFAVKGKQILNPASSDFRDSSAIMVAAASGTVPHTRINYSNYGNRINCYAWGEGVLTAGCFPKSSGKEINTYTDKFGGTSSASAIIAGAAIAVQSITEANYNFRLTPKQMRNILSNEVYSTPSENGRSIDKIGAMPDLRKIIDKGLQCRKESKQASGILRMKLINQKHTMEMKEHF